MASRKSILAVLVAVSILLVVREVQWRISDSRQDTREALLEDAVRDHRSNKLLICSPMKRLVSRLSEEEPLSDSLFYLAAGAFAYCIEDDLSLKVQGFTVGTPDPPMGYAEGLAWLRHELPKAKLKGGPTEVWKAKSE